MNYEKKRKKVVTCALIAIAVALIGLSVALAALSTTLTINGSAEVEPTAWNIYFTDSATGTDPGTGEGREVTATTTGTATGTGVMNSATFTWHATFKTPGDKVVYDLYVNNAGNYNAKVTGISADAGNKTCTKNSSAETVVCGHIHYGVYSDSAGNNLVAVDDQIAKGTVAHYYVIAYLDNTGWALDGSDLPDATVYVNPVQIQITFGQQ